MNKSNDWKPSASISTLSKRADIILKIRKFFNNKGLLEVETPSISMTSVTDTYITSFETKFFNSSYPQGLPLYLITSPEYYMKRLLAFGSGPIFQICHSFRNDELGYYHQPEFTILEWYNLHSDIFKAIQEVNSLLQFVLECNSAQIISYQNLFLQYVGIDPLSSNKNQLYKMILKLTNCNNIVSFNDDYDIMLQLLFNIAIEKYIGLKEPIIVYSFPSSQASLAKININDHRVSDRFEVYYKGIELANGFCELTDPKEQRRRFIQDNIKRAKMNLPQYSIDENILAALESGIPECSGVALGIDRIIMIALKAKNLNEVISFPMKLHI